MYTVQLVFDSLEANARWRWVLKDENGIILVDQDVDLTAPMHGHTADAAALGRVGEAILARAPVTVRVAVPDTREAGLPRPIELLLSGPGRLNPREVSYVLEWDGLPGVSKQPIGDRLRVLAAFGQTIGPVALDLREERRNLLGVIRNIATREIELRVLHYGATRERLDGLLQEAAGWDMIHLCGFHLADGLVLQRSDGTLDPLDIDELVSKLESCKSQLKLLTLCAHVDVDMDWSRHDLARRLVNRLGCAVLVVVSHVFDSAGPRLLRAIYDLCLRSGQPVPRALQLAVDNVLPEDDADDAARRTVLYGPLAADLCLRPPEIGQLTLRQSDLKMARFQDEPELFVPRTASLARATAALSPDSGFTGVMLHGMAAGLGASSFAAELGHGSQEVFAELVWYRAPEDQADIREALSALARKLDSRILGLNMRSVVESPQPDDLDDFLPKLTQLMRLRPVLVVLDDVHRLLTPQGRWRDDRWGRVVQAMVDHAGVGRVVLTGRCLPLDLSPRVRVERIERMTEEQTQRLVRHLPGLLELTNGGAGLTQPDGETLLARTLTVLWGHPELLIDADRQARDPHALGSLLDQVEQASQGLGQAIARDDQDGVRQGLDDLRDHWRRTLPGFPMLRSHQFPGLAPAGVLLFHMLAVLDGTDCEHSTLEQVLPRIWSLFGRHDVPPTLTLATDLLKAATEVSRNQLADGKRFLRLGHPAMAEVGKREVSQEFEAQLRREVAQCRALPITLSEKQPVLCVPLRSNAD